MVRTGFGLAPVTRVATVMTGVSQGPLRTMFRTYFDA